MESGLNKMTIEFEIIPVLIEFSELNVGETFLNFDNVQYKKVAVMEYGGNNITSFVGINPYLMACNVISVQYYDNVKAIIPVPLNEIKIGEFFSPSKEIKTIYIKTDNDYVLINGNEKITEKVYRLEKI